jgi:acyl-CoA dehydrogenase family member 9
MVGAGKAAYEQACKWAAYRYQFDRPIGEFEQIQQKIAAMAAYCYAMDAMLYMTCGIVDRKDDDIMLETAICKVFCSEYGFRTVDHALQIMGGEGYMTENVVERLWRDSRINIIVEGANEVMHSFVFAYGSKQLGEYMIGIKSNPFGNVGAAMKIGAELFLGLRRPAPKVTRVHPRLADLAEDLADRTREFSHQVKMMFKEHEEKLITRQMIQYRLSNSAIWIHAMACSLSRLDKAIRDGLDGPALDHDLAIVKHVFALGGEEIDNCLRALRRNTDRTMLTAAAAAMKRAESLPNSDYVLPEKTPDLSARGKGRKPDQTHIQQFGSGSTVSAENVPV